MDVYEKLNAQLTDALARGVVPWHKPWASTGAPRNAITDRPYRGLNVFVANLAMNVNGWTDPRFVTFNQARQKGGNVRRGEHGVTLCYYGTYSKNAEDENGETVTTNGRFLKTFVVFNLAQCEGLTFEPIRRDGAPVEPIAAAASVYERMTNRPALYHGGDRAFYMPSSDAVHLPEMSQFETLEWYYKVQYHELAHSTGHSSRLGRHPDGWSPFGSHEYSKEELVAECSSMYICGNVGIDPQINATASYCQSWLKVLKGDNKFLISAMSQAQAAVDMIMNLKQDE